MRSRAGEEAAGGAAGGVAGYGACSEPDTLPFTVFEAPFS